MMEDKPARIRVCSGGLVLIDCDVQTLVLHLLCGRPGAPAGLRVFYTIAGKSIFPATIETITNRWTQIDTLEADDEPEGGIYP